MRVIGWGFQSEIPDDPDALQYVDVPYINDTECRKHFERLENAPDFQDRFICVLESDKGACQVTDCRV
jgi:hypothetical protein